MADAPMITRGTVYDVPPESSAPEPMNPGAVWRTEWLAGREPLRLSVVWPRVRRFPRGDGGEVIVIPGWQAPERSMVPVEAMLRNRGHRARTWGLGTIRNDVEAMRDRFVATLAERSNEDPVDLVGWSLGGVIARETARTRPDLVRRVVTFGTPAVGGPTYTAGAGRLGADECRRIEALQRQLDAEQPIATPITAIFTRRDGVVDWRACIDRFSTNVRHVEVTSSHFGLGIDPDVWQITCEALAASVSPAAF